MQGISAQNDLLSLAPHLCVFYEHTVLEWPANHVFLIETDRYFEDVKNGYTAVLSELELEKAGRFLKPADCKSYIVRKYFLRKLLSTFLKCHPKAIQFHQTANKKPGIDGIQFNVSHSENLVVIALSTSPIGIDTEFIKEDFSYGIMLKDCFSLAEQMLINKPKGSLINFYTLWTRKEALLKASGEGLSDHKLHEVEVLLSTGTRGGIPYQLFSSLVLENYILSIAASSPSKKVHYWRI